MHAEPPPRGQHPDKFSSYKLCKSGDIYFSNCHVIWQNNLIKSHETSRKTTWSKDHMNLWVGISHGKSPSCQVWWHRHCDIRVICFSDWFYMILHALTEICHYCLSLKDMFWNHTACHIQKPDPGHSLKAAIEKKFANKFCQSVQKHL